MIGKCCGKVFVATIVVPFCVLNYNCACDDLTRTIDKGHRLPPDPLSGLRTDTFVYYGLNVHNFCIAIRLVACGLKYLQIARIS